MLGDFWATRWNARAKWAEMVEGATVDAHSPSLLDEALACVAAQRPSTLAPRVEQPTSNRLRRSPYRTARGYRS